MINRLHRAAADRAIRTRGVAQRVGVNRELRAHAQVRHHIGVGPRRGQHPITPLHEVMVGVWHGGDRRTVEAVGDGLRRGPADGAVRPRGIAERKGLDLELSSDIDAAHHVGIGPGVVGDPVAPLDESRVGARNRGDRRSAA